MFAGQHAFAGGSLRYTIRRIRSAAIDLCRSSALTYPSRPARRPIASAAVMADEIIDAAFAREIQARARQIWPIVGWCVTAGVEHRAGKYAARLLAGEPSPYVLIADTLDELHASLPPGLTRLPGLPADQPAVVELWFAA
jgi:hypothetical protein